MDFYHYSLKRKESDWIHYCTIACTLWLAYLRNVRGWDSKKILHIQLCKSHHKIWICLATMKSSSKLPTQMEYLYKAFLPLSTDKAERKSPLSFSCYVCLPYPWLDFMVFSMAWGRLRPMLQIIIENNLENKCLVCLFLLLSKILYCECNKPAV